MGWNEGAISPYLVSTARVTTEVWGRGSRPSSDIWPSYCLSTYWLQALVGWRLRYYRTLHLLLYLHGMRGVNVLNLLILTHLRQMLRVVAVCGGWRKHGKKKCIYG